ncbi:MAG: calcium/sodium antiporter [Clostridia bacterium]|nr:calcium/sodium antiporter [Clostridia bacterium]
MLVKGADWFVEGASGIADKMHIPQLVIGLTIVAMGTSAPEAAVSITAALEKSAELSVGNVVGSNILNILIILGLCAVITPVAVAKTTIRYEIPIMLIATALLVLFGMTGGEIVWWEALILLVCFALYLFYMFVMVKRGEMQAEKTETGNKRLWLLMVMGVVGLALIVLGSRFTVDSATALANRFNVPEKFIGLTVVALGTSLPELFTSVVAAKKGKADIAIGNIVGSNIFNILMILGITGVIIDVPFESSFLIDCGIAAFAGILLWLCVFRKKKLKLIDGIIMLASYAAYFVYLVVK